MQPRFGELNDAILAFDATLLQSRTFSVISGILELLKKGDWAIGLVLLVFSVLFPIAKLCAFWHALQQPAEIDSGRLTRFSATLGKYSMLDVLVLALLVVTFKSFPGGTRMTLGAGAWFFCTSVVLSLLIGTFLLRKRG